MKAMHALAIGTIVALGAATTALAQRDAADRADRGQRLDSDAFRNDMLQDQLKKPPASQPWPAGTAEPRASDKPKPAVRKPRPE